MMVVTYVTRCLGYHFLLPTLFLGMSMLHLPVRPYPDKMLIWTINYMCLITLPYHSVIQLVN